MEEQELEAIKERENRFRQIEVRCHSDECGLSYTTTNDSRVFVFVISK